MNFEKLVIAIHIKIRNNYDISKIICVEYETIMWNILDLRNDSVEHIKWKNRA